MKSFLHSFAAGVSSVLSLMPTFRSSAIKGTEIEAIGSDFSAVGRDIRVATEQFAQIGKASKPLRGSNGQEKAEQLELIHTPS